MTARKAFVLSLIGTRKPTLLLRECIVYNVGLHLTYRLSVIPCLNTNHTSEVTDALRQAMLIKRDLEFAQSTLGDVLNWISSQLHDCERQIESLKLNPGFPKLPDDILFLVLESAAEETSGPRFTSHYVDTGFDHDAFKLYKSVQNAFRLSHVCRRFRNVLSSSRHWRNIFSSLDPGMISSCVERCKSTDSPFRFYLSNPVPDGLPHCPISNSHLWERFVIDRRGYAHRVFDADFHYQFTEYAIDHLSNLHLPRLSEIIIMVTETESLDSQCDFNFYASWSTPRLRSMKMSRIIPVPFSGTYTLQSLSIFVDEDRKNFDRDIKSLAAFLKTCLVLEDFSLQVHNARAGGNILEAPPREVPREGRLEIKTVYKLGLFLDSCGSSYLKNLAASISFPSVSVASLRVKGSIDALAHFCNDIQAIFRGVENEDSLTNLSQIHLTVIRTYSEDWLSFLSNVPTAAPTPYTFFACPKLEHLKLTLDGIAPPNFSEGHCLVPALKSIDFSRCGSMTSSHGIPISKSDELLCILKVCGLIGDGLSTLR